MANSSDSDVRLCCLKSCVVQPEGNVIEKDSRKVEVKAFEPKRKTDKLVVSWEKDGSAVFHARCWELLQKATKNGTDLRAELTDVERSMIIEAKKTAEFHDADCTIQAEAEHIVSIFKNCKYCIAFTGAGISTAAGIGDFRGKDGKWTKRDRMKNFGVKSAPAPNRETIMEHLRPTYTHEALQKLTEMGVLKFIISQNVDGLHRLSGVPEDKIAELHGNTFMEKCEDCGMMYELKHHYKKGPQASGVPQKKCSRCNISHRTGRKCSQKDCNGCLMNTVINFGDYLESDVLGSAESHAKMADAVLILGSSLKVSPANDLVMLGKRPHRLMLCNRQTTPYDNECTAQGPGGPLGSRVYGDCDRLMQKIMELLMHAEELHQWEQERETRMAEYALKRTSM